MSGHARIHCGHGKDHDVTVAMIATRIAGSPLIGEMAFCASLLHSIDRNVKPQEGENKLVLIRATMETYAVHLQELFTREQIVTIIESAFRHAELNQDDQSEVQIALMDADRLANLQHAVIIRTGQFMSDLPAFEFEHLSGERNPETTYNRPRSVLDNLRNNIAEYIPKLRLPLAIELGRSYAEKLQAFIDSLEDDYHKLGLVGISL